MNEDKKEELYHLGTDFRIGINSGFNNKNRIYIGDSVEIQNYVTLIVNKYPNTKREYNIKIEYDVFINGFVTIEAINYIEIGKHVMIGPHVYISDFSHKYSNIYVPIKYQGFESSNNIIVIKDGAWIGNQSNILGNVTIGFGSVVAANSVVINDVPNHTVVAGSPAKIIKIYDYKTNEWYDVKNNQSLLKSILKNRRNFIGYDNEKTKGIIEKYKINERKIPEIMDYSQKIVTSLNKMRILLEKDLFLDTFEVFENVISFIAKQQEIIIDLLGKDFVGNLEATVKLNDDLKLMVLAYENKEKEKVSDILINKLIPDFDIWKPEINGETFY